MDSLRKTLDNVLSTSYRIERELGGGGMSRVFLADEVALGRQVVVKVLPPDMTVSVSADRFRREIQVAAQLQHPHIVPVLSAGAADGLLYFTMPFVEGSSLRERLTRGPLTVADAVRIWREVLDALSYAHAHGVVHRDIKPENILLSGRHATVTDFGVARAMQAATGEERVTATGMVLGTPAYMAPEQAAAERNVDHRVDIYAAGLVMYEMLTGASPFGGLSMREQLMAHITREPESIALKQPHVPAPLVSLVMRCLAKDPAARPPNADAALAELDQIVTPTMISPAAGVRPLRRRRWLVPAIAAALVVLAGGAWAAKGRLGLGGPPAPPAHDSLRLRVVTTSLQHDAADSTLARRVRDAALAELEKEPWLFVVTPTAVTQSAPFLGIDAKHLALPDTIRKYMRRSRTHAFLDFSVLKAGAGYVLSAQAHGARTDTSLEVLSEPAADAAALPIAMSRLGQRIRSQLVNARATLPPTAFAQFGVHASPEVIELMIEAGSDFDRRDLVSAVRRARSAVAIDSTMLWGWMLIDYSLSTSGTDTRGRLDAVSRAYRLRHRDPSPITRLEIAAAYWNARGDDDRTLASYDSLVRLLPSGGGWNNLGVVYTRQRRFDLATRVYRRSIDTTYKYLNVPNSNLVQSLLREERVTDAREEAARVWRADSQHVQAIISQYVLATALRDFDAMERMAMKRFANARTAGDSVAPTNYVRAAAMNRGQLHRFDSLTRVRSRRLKTSGTGGDYLSSELERARFHARLAGDTARARQIADSALAEVPWESVDPLDRPWSEMIRNAAARLDTARGNAIAREWSRAYPAEWKARDSAAVLLARGELALVAGDAREALRLFRLGDLRAGPCNVCAFPRFARAFDALRQLDSARMYFERYADAHAPANPFGDAAELAHTYLRLGELYEERRDPASAIKWYTKFTDLWASADEPLQAKVREVRQRVERLRKATG
jgi:tetratricopeptide (TPR) repeat protein